MRQILVDHARAHYAAKRGGDYVQVTLADAAGTVQNEAIELITLDKALARLAAMDPRQCQVIELRHVGGLTITGSR